MTPGWPSRGSPYPPRERVNGPLTHDPKNDREDKSNCSKAQTWPAERAPPAPERFHQRPPQGGSLPNTGRLGKFLSHCEGSVGVIEQFRVKAGEYTEKEADEAAWEPLQEDEAQRSRIGSRGAEL